MDQTSSTSQIGSLSRFQSHILALETVAIVSTLIKKRTPLGKLVVEQKLRTIAGAAQSAQVVLEEIQTFLVTPSNPRMISHLS